MVASKLTGSLPVISTLTDALSFLCRNYRLLLKIGLPAVIAGSGYVASTHFYPVDDQINDNDVPEAFIENLISQFPFSVPSFVMFAVFCTTLVMAVVGCHRLLLIGEKSVNDSKIPNWTGNEIRYTYFWILISLGIGLLLIPFLIVVIPITYIFGEDSTYYWLEESYYWFIVVYLSILYFVSRWSLVLPAAAIGKQGISFSWSWNISTGNGWRLTLLISIFPGIISSMLGILPITDSLLSKVFHGAIWFFVGVVEVVLLSLSYKYLTDTEN